MAITFTPISIGSTANDGTGDKARAAAQKINSALQAVVDAINAFPTAIAATDLPLISTAGGGTGTDILVINRPGTGVDYQQTITALAQLISTLDGSVDPAGLERLSVIPSGGFALVGYRLSDMAPKLLLSTALGSGSTGGSTGTAPGQVGSLAAGTPTSTTVPLTWTAPTTGTGTFVYSVQQSLHGANSWTNSAGTFGSTGGTVTGLTASTSYDFRVIVANGTAPNSVTTLTGEVSSGAGGGGLTYPAMTLSNSPAYDTTTPLQGAASLSAGSGVMASGIVPPSGTQGVTLECFIRTTAPGFGAQFLRLDDASGHWIAAIFNQGTDSGNSNLYHISPQTETYQGVPYSGTSPVSGQRCHVALQTTSNGKVAVWIDGVLNTGTGDATALSMTDALKATINVSSAGLTDMDSVRLSAGRRYTENQNFTPPTSMVRDSSTMVIYTFDAQNGAGS